MDCSTTRMPHLPMLDGLRALAILIVMAAHTDVTHLIPGGFGVTIFFFLSGYLITSLLRIEAAAHGRIDLRDFYWRRTIRIFPPLYITMALLLLAIATGLLPTSLSAPALLVDALFLTNYAPVMGVGPGLPVPFWSLNVEEHFYLLFSTIFAVLFVRMPARRAAFWCLAGCGVVLAMRIVNVAVLSDFSYNYYWSHTRLDSILFGCCLALWNNPALDRAPWRPHVAHLVLALGVLLACLQIRNDVFRETIRYSLQGAALFVVFSAVLQDRGLVARALSWLPLRIVALLSYTLYLVHMPMALIVEQGLDVEHPFALHAITLALSFSYAGAMYLLVERPLARWRRSRDSDQRAIIAPSLATAPR